MDLLFHPKKNKKPAQPPPPRKTPPTPRPKPAIEKEDNGELQLPDWPFQEFRLLSSALNGWKYDVVKFDSRKTIDVSKWVGPVKLNRKDLRRDEPATEGVPKAVGPMLGPDGKPVIGTDGKVVMIDMEGKPIHPTDVTSSPKDRGKGANNAAATKKRFQKKTKQVFYVPEEVRQLRKEERYPWVLEDSHPANKELWIGQLEEVSKAETHAFFMPAANDVFKFVPAHRWYKFQKKLKHSLPTDTAGVEQLVCLMRIYSCIVANTTTIWFSIQRRKNAIPRHGWLVVMEVGDLRLPRLRCSRQRLREGLSLSETRLYMTLDRVWDLAAGD
jgi:transcription initiation factor TFIIF subunit alpha